MAERQGVEIDYCPDCRGIWLDRGELDKIIERSAQATSAPPLASANPSHAASPWLTPAGYGQQHVAQSGHRAEHHHDDDDNDHGRGRGRRESWIERLFD
jgi:Zn-finger nucleic acid-binding protein